MLKYIKKTVSILIVVVMFISTMLSVSFAAKVKYTDISDDYAPKSFTGLLVYDENNKSKINISFDARWFFDSPQDYNPKLSTLSDIVSAQVYGNIELVLNENGKEVLNSKKSKDLFEILGFSDILDYTVSDDYTRDNDTTEAVIGHQNIIYKGEEKTIILIGIRGTSKSYSEWASNLDIGDINNSDLYGDWENTENHKGFDVTANRILKRVDQYIKDNNIEKDKTVYWTTGHSRGGAISNIIGAIMEDKKINCFTYTFASPSTTLSKNASKYKTIFNIVNNDDVVTCIPSINWGYQRYGITKEMSGMEYCDKSTGYIETSNGSKVEYLKTLDKISGIPDLIDKLVPSGNNPREYLYKCEYSDSYVLLSFSNKNEYTKFYDGKSESVKSFLSKLTKREDNSKYKVYGSLMDYVNLIVAMAFNEISIGDFITMPFGSSYKVGGTIYSLISNIGLFNLFSGKDTINDIFKPHALTVYYTLCEEYESRTIVVVPNDLSKVYGEEDPELTYTVQYGSKNLITGKLSRNNGENAGEYTINIGSLKPTNSKYEIVCKSNKKLTIEKAKAPVIDTEKVEYIYAIGSENIISIDIYSLLPSDCGKTNIDKEVTGDSEIFETLPYISEGKLVYSVGKLDGFEDKDTVLKLNIKMQNYENTSFIYEIDITDKHNLVLKEGESVTFVNNEILSGEHISELIFNDAIFVDEITGETVNGKLSFEDENYLISNDDETAKWIFVPDDSDRYLEYHGETEIVVIELFHFIPFTGNRLIVDLLLVIVYFSIIAGIGFIALLIIKKKDIFFGRKK